jgi:tRNA-dihydrouridine synthase A
MRVNTQLLPDNLSAPIDRRFCVAPMLDWTDRHCRYWLRLIFPDALLYTEMVTTDAMLHGDRERLLAHDPSEHPVALQLGGSHLASMVECARITEDYGYDELNINVGCPSERVQSGAFGACLMAEPDIVAGCVEAMQRVVDIPVTVKTRIGIDELDDYEHLYHFVSVVAAAGCKTFIIHARKAYLKGLSPKENREVPPLDYPRVYRLKRDFPQLEIIINGGLKTIDEIMPQFRYVDGVMVGRGVYQDPYSLIGLRHALYGEQQPLPDRRVLVERYLDYVCRQTGQGVYLNHMTRHILGLFQGVPGAKRWRRFLSERACIPGAGVEVIEEALRQANVVVDYNAE